MNHLLYLFFFLPAFAISQSISVNQWKEDIAFLKEELPKKHVNLFHSLSELDFNKAMDSLTNNIDVSTKNLSIIYGMQGVLNSTEDSHTYASLTKNQKSNQQFLPLKFITFSDGIFLFNSYEKHKKAIGLRLKSIDGKSINDLTKSLHSYFRYANSATVKKNVAKHIVLFDLLKHLGIYKNDVVSFVFEDKNKQDVTIQVKPIQRKNIDKSKVYKMKLKTIPLFYTNNKRWFWKQMFQDSVLYIKYNKCISREVLLARNNGKSNAKIKKATSFKNFSEDILKDIQIHSPKKIIIDFRGNSGGSSSQGDVLIKSLFQLKNTYNYNIVGIIDEYVYSSAVLNATTIKILGGALVGDETSGAPNHFGEIKSFMLPNSMTEIKYSSKYFKRVKGDPNSLKPDYLATNTFYELINGKDNMLQKAIEL